MKSIFLGFSIILTLISTLLTILISIRYTDPKFNSIGDVSLLLITYVLVGVFWAIYRDLKD